MKKLLKLEPDRDRYTLAEAVNITSSHLYALPDDPQPKLVKVGNIDVAGAPLSIPEHILKGIRQLHTVTLLEMLHRQQIRALSLESQTNRISLGGELGLEDLDTFYLTPKEFRGFCKELGIKVEKPAAAPAVALPGKEKSAQSPDEPAVMKTNVLVATFKHEWTSIERDIREASRNGLCEARAEHGFYFVDKALEWAKSRGKIKQTGARPNTWHPQKA